VTFSVRFRHPIWIEDLIRLVEESASSELYSLLKRPDEKAVTERAYDNPVFVEDLVRNLAERADAHEEITWYRVEAEKFRVDSQSQRLRADRTRQVQLVHCAVWQAQGPLRRPHSWRTAGNDSFSPVMLHRLVSATIIVFWLVMTRCSSATR
jgi:hypothetical protein